MLPCWMNPCCNFFLVSQNRGSLFQNDSCDLCFDEGSPAPVEMSSLSAPWSKKDRPLPYQDSTRQPAGLIWKLSRSLGPRARHHLVSILPALSNETWPALEEKWIIGPSIPYFSPLFEVADAIERGNMSCVKVIIQFLRTNLVCLMFPMLRVCCGFIYPDSSQTDRVFHLAQTSGPFSISFWLL